jgi:hypothetical protein
MVSSLSDLAVHQMVANAGGTEKSSGSGARSSSFSDLPAVEESAEGERRAQKGIIYHKDTENTERKGF